MKRKLLTALAAVILIPGAAKAQSTTAGGSVTLNIPQVLSIAFTSNADVSFTPTQTDFDAGFMDGVSATLRTKGNTPHEIRVRSATSAFNYSGSVTPAPSKSASDFQWKVGAGTFLGMSTSNNSVGTYARGTHDVTVDYKLVLDYANDPEGSYDMSFTYEVVPN